MVGRVLGGADARVVVLCGGVEVGRKGDDGSVGQQQRCEGKRGRRKQIRALQQDDRSGSEQAEQKDGSDAEAIERLALLCGEEYDEDGDGYEENDVVDHGRERKIGGGAMVCKGLGSLFILLKQL